MSRFPSPALVQSLFLDMEIEIDSPGSLLNVSPSHV